MEEIKNIQGGTLFVGEYESFKHCVEDAVRKGVNLSYADLSYADLSYAYLSGAYLTYADLRGANLYRADLTYADLYRADLRGAHLFRSNLENARLSCANLYYANLKGARLTGANLWGCTGNGREIKSSSEFLEYEIAYTAEVLQIGCENHKIEDWWKFRDHEIREMEDEKALEFWRKNKDTIQNMIEQNPATTTGWEIK